MADIYVRVDNEQNAYLRQLVDESGMTLAAVVRTLIDGARREGWSVSARPGMVVKS